MKPLSKLVKDVLYQAFRKQHPLMAHLMINWTQIVGREIGHKTYPLKISHFYQDKKKYYRLYISADDRYVAQMVYYTQGVIIERIAIYLGYKAIVECKALIRDNVNL